MPWKTITPEIRARRRAQALAAYHRNKDSVTPEMRAAKAAYMHEWQTKNAAVIKAKRAAKYAANREAEREALRVRHRAKRGNLFVEDVKRTPIEGETWRAITGYEGWYDVSNLGRVCRVAPDPPNRANRLVNPIVQEEYLFAPLTVLNRTRRLPVHHLVAVAFIGPRPSMKHEINHKDTDRAHNVPSNLEWVTPQQNQQHRLALAKLRKTAVGPVALSALDLNTPLALEYEPNLPAAGHRSRRSRSPKGNTASAENGTGRQDRSAQAVRMAPILGRIRHRGQKSSKG